jgi:hypothetical protein
MLRSNIFHQIPRTLEGFKASLKLGNARRKYIVGLLRHMLPTIPPQTSNLVEKISIFDDTSAKLLSLLNPKIC